VRGHRVPLGDGFDVWRLVAVRGAGFPIAGLLPLGAPAAVAAAEAGDPRYRAIFAAEMERVADAVERIVADPRFHEAMLWQNRRAARGVWFEPGERRLTPARNQARRRREDLVVKYWQRYCAKNDSIGFFGPVGWGELDPELPLTDAAAGPNLVSGRAVLLEAWCVAAFAAALERDERLTPWLAPALSLELALEGALLRGPRGVAQRLTPGEAALLAACDGRPANAIAVALAADPASGFRGEADVLLQLDNLRRRGIVRWDLSLPHDLHAERLLRERLTAVGDEDARAAALRALDELVEARDRVAAASGPAELDASLGELDATFTRLTGSEAVHAPGQVYAGRTLAYLDCRRDLTLIGGRDLLDALREPLGLLLRSLRWLTGQTRDVYEEAFRDLHGRLAQDGRSRAVELSELWYWAQGLLFGGQGRPIDSVMADFRWRWTAALGLDAGGDLLELSPAELRPRVEELFGDCAPGWPGARYHCPDVQVAAASLNDLRAGRFELVLGEVHAAWNSVDTGLFVGQHPRPDELLAAVEADVPEPRVIPLVPQDWPRQAPRTRRVLIRPRDVRLAHAPVPPDPGMHEHVPVTALVVEDVEGRLVARTRDGRHELGLIECFGELLSMVVADCFRSLSLGTARPRVRIGRMTVIRRSWTFRPRDADFIRQLGEPERFRGARQWACALGLPRFVFLHVPGELKPFLVDLESPISVNILSTFLRSACQRALGGELATAVEMLPRPDQCWLPDPQGHGCASELRIVVVDTTP
jgi:hypothetical protein